MGCLSDKICSNTGKYEMVENYEEMRYPSNAFPPKVSEILFLMKNSQNMWKKNPIKVQYQERRKLSQKQSEICDFILTKKISSGLMWKLYEGKFKYSPETFYCRAIDVSSMAEEEFTKDIQILEKVANIYSPFLHRIHSIYISYHNNANFAPKKKIYIICDSYENNLLHLMAERKIEGKRVYLTKTEILQILVQLVAGLLSLGMHSIVHYGIKIPNILYKYINVDGENILLCQIADSGEPFTEINMTKSELRRVRVYMAPEVYAFNVEENGKMYGEEAHSWSLGMILHEMMYRSRVFPENFDYCTRISMFDYSNFKPTALQEKRVIPEIKSLLDELLVKDLNQRIKMIDFFEKILKFDECQSIKKLIKYDEQTIMNLQKYKSNPIEEFRIN